ncbi:hypothetical protein EB155_12695 [archaeon]|nr:hypothetical protein [archaeon]
MKPEGKTNAHKWLEREYFNDSSFLEEFEKQDWKLRFLGDLIEDYIRYKNKPNESILEVRCTCTFIEKTSYSEEEKELNICSDCRGTIV